MALIPTLAEFFSSLTKKGALLALDVSDNNIGIAISDETRKFSAPHSVYARVKFQQDAEYLLKYVRHEKIAGIIVGFPLNMDDTIGPRAQSCRSFALNLSRLTEVPIVLADERLSTAEAHDMADSLGMNANERAKKLDAIAAHMILERAINQASV